MLNLKRASFLKVVLLTSFAVTGCAAQQTPTRAQKQIAASAPEFCTTAMPIYINDKDVISDDTARQILQHNKTGRKLCKW